MKGVSPLYQLKEKNLPFLAPSSYPSVSALAQTQAPPHLSPYGAAPLAKVQIQQGKLSLRHLMPLAHLLLAHTFKSSKNCTTNCDV